MTKMICKIMGAAFIAIGILGYFVPHFLGMHLSPFHNIIHIASGLAALYFGIWGSYRAAQIFSGVFGFVYLSLGILGFASPETAANVLHAATDAEGNLTADNLVHVVLGSVFLAAAFVPIAVHPHQQTPASRLPL